MTTNAARDAPQRLTAKGQATRAHILECAAELIYRDGVQATSNDRIRREAGVSGSQIAHYFPTKESLVAAVIAWQADRVLGFLRSERFDGFGALAAFRDWAGYYVAYERARTAGCTLGSLASEIIKTDLAVRDELADAFAQWRKVLADGLAQMRDREVLRSDADPVRLANLLLAAFQGGMLLAQVDRDVTPLRDALTAAIDHVESFATA